MKKIRIMFLYLSVLFLCACSSSFLDGEPKSANEDNMQKNESRKAALSKETDGTKNDEGAGLANAKREKKSANPWQGI